MTDKSPTLLGVAAALSQITGGIAPLGAENADLLSAAGRTLAVPLRACLTHPPFDCSAMDGYAVRAADVAAPNASLKVMGESAAGWPFGDTAAPGQAVRIFTGAAMPDGADSVIIQENVTADGDAISASAGVKPGANIRRRGQDFVEGDEILVAGRRLTASDILLAATAGHAVLAVRKAPIVAILATGDELVEPSDRPTSSQIVASNSYGLAALATAAGAHPRLIGIARDDPEDLARKLGEAAGADVLVTTGGASVGEHDIVRSALMAAGATIGFWKLAIRPGKPVFYGTFPNGQRVLGLPGNPVSAMVAARLFLLPLISCYLGRDTGGETMSASVTTPLGANGARVHYMRAVLDLSGDIPRVTPLSSQDSSMVRMLAQANALIVIPADAPPADAGSTVSVMRLDF